MSPEEWRVVPGLEAARDRLLCDVRLTAFERVVAEALCRAEGVDEVTADPYAFQSFREEMHLSPREHGWLDNRRAFYLCRLPTLARVVSSLAQWMVHGPERSHLDRGPCGTVVSLPRLPGVVDGETGYELPPGHRLEIDVLEYYPYSYLRMSGVDGSYSEQPTVAVRLRCRWRLEPVEACGCHFGYVKYNDRGDAMPCPYCHTIEELRAVAMRGRTP